MDPFEHDSLARRLAPETDRAAWYETTLLTILGFAMGWYIQPEDPLFT